MRLVAADSTTLRLPPWPENRDEFGVQADASGQPYVLARALGLYATASRLMLHTVLGRYDDGERALLVRLLPQLDENDLLIIDRGLPAVWLFAGLQQLKRHFLARMDGTQWPEVKALLRSSQTETVFTREVSDHARRKAKATGFELAATTLTVRLIKVVLPSGQIEVLATSLLDATAYTPPVTSPAFTMSAGDWRYTVDSTSILLTNAQTPPTVGREALLALVAWLRRRVGDDSASLHELPSSVLILSSFWRESAGRIPADNRTPDEIRGSHRSLFEIQQRSPPCHAELRRLLFLRPSQAVKRAITVQER